MKRPVPTAAAEDHSDDDGDDDDDDGEMMDTILLNDLDEASDDDDEVDLDMDQVLLPQGVHVRNVWLFADEACGGSLNRMMTAMMMRMMKSPSSLSRKLPSRPNRVQQRPSVQSQASLRRRQLLQLLKQHRPQLPSRQQLLLW